MRRFGLIVVGDEILSGKRSDKHLGKIIALLSARNLALSWAHYVGDEPASITATLQRSFASGDVVFSTGGIGATTDDHTRQAAAVALNVDLVLHPEAERLIIEHVIRKYPDSLKTGEGRQRLKMGEFPAGAEIVPNPYNGVPGFSIREHYFVPGFPVMAWPMMEWVLDTHYADLFNRAVRAERSMLVFETPESRLTPVMERIEARYPGIKVFSLPTVPDPQRGGKWARWHAELGVKGPAALVPDAYASLKEEVLALTSDIDEEVDGHA